jgi:catechol 2,3-dioxygenase-like lactoylglutathione lyase family enzyme
MFDHVGFAVSDLARAKAFYAAALAPLGFVLVVDGSDPDTGIGHAGFGFPGRPQFWINTHKPLSGDLHVAFPADNRGAVDAFHAAALKAGGSDNGAPGLRPTYHQNYYAAFVRDHDGHNIEAVCHFPGRFEDQFAADRAG